jgi:hypothetical protein
MRLIAIVAASLLAAAPGRAGAPTPLFADDDKIAIAIAAPWSKIARAAPTDKPFEGLLTIGDETHPVLIGTRGKSRREKHVCEFPPLRVEFSEPPPASSLFHKQKKLKLTSYCRRSSAHQQYVLREYAAYRLYNAVTDQSFRVRLADVSYVDAKSGDSGLTRAGFFIEDLDDLAKRVDLKEVERGRTPNAMFDQQAAARAAVFQYMIGNLDWDMGAGPAGENCCHNSKILGTAPTAESGLIPAPYDFDMSGLVDAPYALPPAQFRIRSVTSRVFRGFCAHNAETIAAAADALSRRPTFDGVIAAIPGLTEKSRKKAGAFLDGFYKSVATEADVRKNLLSDCRS